MSKSDVFENDLVKLLLWGTPIAGIADNAASAPLTQFYLSLHTADPSEAGTQTTAEAAYVGYARVAIGRNSTALDIVGNTGTLKNIASFPQATGGTAVVTH